MWFFIKNTSTEFRGGYFAYQTKYIDRIGNNEISTQKNQNDTKC